jgi:hypothetical protein
MTSIFQSFEKHGKKIWRLLALIALHGAHNLKVVGSNPTPATKHSNTLAPLQKAGLLL